MYHKQAPGWQGANAKSINIADVQTTPNLIEHAH